jgi:penicillin-binding protein-related factor A (putative recombinase)
MTERGYTKRLVKLFNSVPGCVCRALSDTGIRGHKKPYDFFIIYKGIHISAEAKFGNGKLEEHQKRALQEDYDAGGKCFCIRD